MVTTLIIGIIGYIIGAAVAWYICRPTKAFHDGWNAGYNSAKNIYGDWDRGFHDGWKSAFEKVDEALFTPINELQRRE